jgi:DNA-binding MarR family transcriptional regulator
MVTGKGMEVIGLLKEVLSFFRHNMNRALQKSGLTMPQGMLLAVLGKKARMKIHELGSSLFMADSTVSGIVDRLEKQGFVERARSVEDKRVVFVSLSPKFEEKKRNLYGFINKNMEKTISKATPGELEEIRHGLKILKRLMSGIEKDKNDSSQREIP